MLEFFGYAIAVLFLLLVFILLFIIVVTVVALTILTAINIISECKWNPDEEEDFPYGN